MSYDTKIAEVLLVAQRLGKRTRRASRRGVFVNLWRAAYQETDALALVNAINSASLAPLHRSDGPPVGGGPLFVGGEQWGELIEGPVGAEPWKASRWKHGLIGQFAAALGRSELWADDGAHVVGRIPTVAMSKVCNVGPEHKRIRGLTGVFEAYHGPYGKLSSLPSGISTRRAVAGSIPRNLESGLVGPSRFTRRTQRLARTEA